jgi:imidazolonepropionase-like amidohydrolase
MKMRIANCKLRSKNRSLIVSIFGFGLFFLLTAHCSLLTVSAQLNPPSQQNIAGENGTFVIRGARIVTVSGAPVENGSIVIQNGRIAAVGANVSVPTGATVIDGAGMSVYPGMIDAGTNMGLMEIPLGAPGTDDDGEIGDMNPNARALTGVNPHSTHIPVTRVNGITTVLTAPQEGVIAGEASVINLLGSTHGEMAVTPAFALVINFPRVSTFGGFGGGGGFGAQQPDFSEAVRTRDRRLDEIRRMLRDAEAYGKAQDAFARDNKLPRPATNLRLAALVPYVRGERQVIMIADREVDIRNAVRFADEMKLKPIITGGNEAWKAADLLKQKNIPVILTGIWSLPGRPDDYYDVLYENPAKLQRAGVRFAISSGDSGANVRDLPYQAGMAGAFGLSPDEALKSVTLYPAQILGISDRMGSLEVGKIGNVVVASGDILDPRTKIMHLFINGRKVPLTSKHTELYERFKDRKLPQ